MEQHGERLQKVLARAGVASRRHAEELIAAGRVRVNGRVVTELGTRVDGRRDKVELDGRRVVMEAPVYFLFHKPRGTVTTMVDPEGRPTISDHFKDVDARVFPVGRLDYQTSGALLITNDGALANALTHPRHHVAKVYVAKVRGVVTDLQIEPWRTGMMLPPSESDPDERQVPTAPAGVKVLRVTPPSNDEASGSTWLEVTLREGRTRQIHRMAEATGLFVMRLARITFAGLSTSRLRPGDRRALTDKEITTLKKLVGLAPEDPADARAEPPRREAPARGPKGRGAPARAPGGGKAPRPPQAPRHDAQGAREAPRGPRAPGRAPPPGAPTSERGRGAPRRDGDRRGSRGPDAPQPEGTGRSPRPHGGFQRAPGGRGPRPDAPGRPPSRPGAPRGPRAPEAPGGDGARRPPRSPTSSGAGPAPRGPRGPRPEGEGSGSGPKRRPPKGR